MQMTNDLISRQAAIDVLGWFSETDPLGHTPVQIVRALPTAEPRKGKWKVWCHGRQGDGLYAFSYSCSECGFPGDKTDYCPNCGARMEESE